MFADGRIVQSAEDWRQRRLELQDQILAIEYGHLPPTPPVTSGELLMRNRTAWNARQIQYRVRTGPDLSLSFLLDLFLPAGNGPFPVMLNGDACWPEMTPDKAGAVLRHGYALAHFNRLEFASDNVDLGRTDGLYRCYPGRSFGALAAWAWGYSRALDFLFTLDCVNSDRICAVGASRGGKTVLLAAALDERIALCAPNNSGCCGAGCFRYQGPGSETLKEMLRDAAFWLAPGMAEYRDREHALPFDQHALKALVAPRLLVTTEALGDLYANPTGTWLTHAAAREVYRFLGVGARIGISFREGEHGHSLADWETVLAFADHHFKGAPLPQRYDHCPFPELAGPA